LPLREKTQRVEATNKEMLGTSPEYRRITSKGQVTIPIAIRRRYSITMHTKLEFIPQPEGITIKPVRKKEDPKIPMVYLPIVATASTLDYQWVRGYP